VGVVGVAGESSVRETERNGNLWDCLWVFLGAGCETAVRGT